MVNTIVATIASMTLAAAVQVNCPGDANGDGVVDVKDILRLVNMWNQPDPGGADFDEDGLVDVDDLGILLQWWGHTCEDTEYEGCVIFGGTLALGGCGRPIWDSEPNGFFIVLVDTWSVFGSNLPGGCDWFPAAPPRDNGFTTVPYPVAGDNLQQVGDAIYDPKNGSGEFEDGRRHAMSTNCQIDHGGELGWEDGKLTYQITEITFKLTMRVPEWSIPDGANKEEIKEWIRFMQASRVHEIGHVQRFKAHYAAVRKKFEGTPAGLVSIPNVATPPTFDDKGNPADEASAAVITQLSTTTFTHIMANATVMAMMESHTSYDAPPSDENPDGTDHGKTQEAHLDY